MKLHKDESGHWCIDIDTIHYELLPTNDKDPQSFEVFVDDDFVAELSMEKGCLIADVPGPLYSMNRVYETQKPKGVGSLLPGEQDRFLSAAIESVHSYRKHEDKHLGKVVIKGAR